MAAILTAAEMRALEQAAIASGEVTGLELMERAGRGVVEAILDEWPEIAGHRRRAVVLCGPGNNGGDGFVVARLLAERGWTVEVHAMAEPDAMPPDARTSAVKWLAAERRVVPLAKDTFYRSDPADVYVDALFGIGLSRPLEGEAAQVVRYLAGSGGDWDHFSRRVVSIDVPSGLDADTGRVPGCPEPDPFHSGAPYARLTVTFDSPKPGHYLAHGPALCGRLSVVDIGLGARRHLWSSSPDPELRTRRGLGLVRLALVEPRPDGERADHVDPMGFAYPIKPKFIAKRTGHKYAHGHALLLSGGCGRGGAARLAARGALRIGAGLVTLAVPPAALQENAARLDAVMLRSVKDAEALANLLSDARYNALAVGPGLGTTDREAALLHALLDASRPVAALNKQDAETAGNPSPAPQKGRAVVLDADALTLVARDDTLRAKLHDRCVLTPHDGEFARLFPAIAERLRAPATTGPAYSKVDAARDAAKEVGSTVLLKGPDTVIADPSGRAAINAAVYDRAAPWLATAGSGDVLSGMICGLLARGFAPFDAACTAAWLHVEAARSFGPGLIAEDLPEELPKVFRALGL
jgi:hydroxyethylthiazole kinase-like uncharacterized protein yjeF